MCINREDHAYQWSVDRSAEHSRNIGLSRDTRAESTREKDTCQVVATNTYIRRRATHVIRDAEKSRNAVCIIAEPTTASGLNARNAPRTPIVQVVAKESVYIPSDFRYFTRIICIWLCFLFCSFTDFNMWLLESNNRVFFLKIIMQINANLDKLIQITLIYFYLKCTIPCFCEWHNNNTKYSPLSYFFLYFIRHSYQIHIFIM